MFALYQMFIINNGIHAAERGKPGQRSIFIKVVIAIFTLDASAETKMQTSFLIGDGSKRNAGVNLNRIFIFIGIVMLFGQFVEYELGGILARCQDVGFVRIRKILRHGKSFLNVLDIAFVRTIFASFGITEVPVQVEFRGNEMRTRQGITLDALIFETAFFVAAVVNSSFRFA